MPRTIRLSAVPRRAAGAAVATAVAATALTGASAAPAAALPSAATAAHTAPGLARSLGAAPHAAHSVTIVIPAGARHVGGSADGVGYAITPAVVSPQTSTCTLTVGAPTWVTSGPNGNDILSSAGISCDLEFAEADITVGVYLGTSPYPLQHDTTTYGYSASSMTGFDYCPISQNGYYIAGAVGDVGSPVDGRRASSVVSSSV